MLFLDRLSKSLSAKIAVAFAVVLLLHASIAVLAHIGLDRAQSGIARFDREWNLAQHMIGIDRKVGNLQRGVLRFTYTGHRSVLAQVDSAMTELVQDLDVAKSQLTMASELEEIEAMRSASLRYREQFQLVIADRQLRKDIVSVKMLDFSRRGGEIFRQLLDATEAGEVLSYAPSVGRAHQSFLEAEAGARRYIQALDSSATIAAGKKLDDCKLELDRVNQGTRGEFSEALKEAYAILPEYRQLMVRLVQTTRGYLHLVNVVMAGEAAEFLRTSSRLREAHMARLDQLSSDIRADQRRFQLISLVVSIGTIIIGLLASSSMRRVVVDPLRRITKTLTRLARGEDTESIPGLDRGDEVGAMAQAADVFRQKNLETSRMLGEIRDLASKHEHTIADLETTNRELDNFAHIASHDLKAPLRAMGLLATWVLEDSDAQLSKDSKENLLTLKARVDRMTRLLNDLLLYAKAGRAMLPVERFDVIESAKEAIELSGIPPEFETEILGTATFVETAPTPFLQVLQNLISNAAKHHDSQSGKIVVSVKGHGDAVEVAVRDDGPGIAAAYQEKIFEPFTTLRSRDEIDASGVGLALVQKIVDRYGGTIKVDSSEGEGATFTLRWPNAK